MHSQTKGINLSRVREIEMQSSKEDGLTRFDKSQKFFQKSFVRLKISITFALAIPNKGCEKRRGVHLKQKYRRNKKSQATSI